MRLLTDPELAAAYGRAGRARVERELAVDTMVARTEALYDELSGPAVVPDSLSSTPRIRRRHWYVCRARAAPPTRPSC